MTDLLRERGVFESYPFVLLDVGCPGGIDEAWRAFGPSLVARGYDPDVGACEKAKAGEPFDDMRYYTRFVGLPDASVRQATGGRGRVLARHQYLGPRHGRLPGR